MQPDLMNIKNKIEASRDLVDRITMKLPGYKGSVEKSERYDADKIVREFLTDRIQSFKNEMTAFFAETGRKGDVMRLSELESLNLNLEKLHKKFKYAEAGSQAVLAKMKMTDEDHVRLIEYDWRLISSIDEYKDLIEKLKNSSDADFTATLAAVRTKLNDFERSFDERKNVLLEVI